ncbi:hypothetical protein J4038_14440 [Cellulomonas sp. zg-ZUI40]|nr:hypothetical protein [Cellulomonas dongxiuzhuiae]
MTDLQGRTVDCRHLHVLLTANTGARDLTRAPTGSGNHTSTDGAARAVQAVRALLPDEVFNRLDDVLVLWPIDQRTAGRVLGTGGRSSSPDSSRWGISSRPPRPHAVPWRRCRCARRTVPAARAARWSG